MAAVTSGLDRGQVPVQMHEQRAGDVRPRVLLRAERRIAQVVPAVEDAPFGVARKVVRGNERREQAALRGERPSVRELAMADGSELRARQGRNGDRFTVACHEFDLIALTARMNEHRRAHVSALEAQSGQIHGEHDAIQFPDHVLAFGKRVRGDKLRFATVSLNEPYYPHQRGSAIGTAKRSVDPVALAET